MNASPPPPDLSSSGSCRLLSTRASCGPGSCAPSVPNRRRAAGELLAAGHHGEMQYMDGALDRSSPAALLDSVQSVLVVALPYVRPTPLRRSVDGSGAGRAPQRTPVRALRPRRRLPSRAEAEARAGGRQDLTPWSGAPWATRVCRQRAALERDLAERAGSDSRLKSTLTILPGVGSFRGCSASCCSTWELAPTPAANHERLWLVHQVPEPRAPRARFRGIRLGRATLHLVPDHRAEGRRPDRASPADRPACIRLRYLPRRLPVEHSRMRRRRMMRLSLCQIWYRCCCLTSSGYRKLIAPAARCARFSRARLGPQRRYRARQSHDRAEAPLARPVATNTSELVRSALGLGPRLASAAALARQTALEHAAATTPRAEVRHEARAGLSLYASRGA